MTIHELVNQLHGLSVGGYFNGEKFSKSRLTDYIRKMLSGRHNRLIMEISLPDGRWFFTVNRFSQANDGYDYYIPNNRENESVIKNSMHISRQGERLKSWRT